MNDRSRWQNDRGPQQERMAETRVVIEKPEKRLDASAGKFGRDPQGSFIGDFLWPEAAQPKRVP
jgi:hypothetical protein